MSVSTGFVPVGHFDSVLVVRRDDIFIRYVWNSLRKFEFVSQPSMGTILTYLLISFFALVHEVVLVRVSWLNRRLMAKVVSIFLMISTNGAMFI